jgi:type II secretory pathway component PulK
MFSDTFDTQDGFALPLVLGISAMITIIILTISDSVSRKIAVTTELVNHVQAELAAVSGFNQALYFLLQSTYTSTGLHIHSSVPPPGPDTESVTGSDARSNIRSGTGSDNLSGTFWNLYGDPIVLEPDTVLVLRDTAGMVSPLFPSRVFFQVLSSLSEDVDQPARIMDALNDWQDKDDFRRLNGAEAWDYRERGLPYTPRNAYIQSLSELYLIKHVEPDLIAGMSGHLVYWPSDNINYLTMPEDLLKMVIQNDDITGQILTFRENRQLSPTLFTALTGIRPAMETTFYPSGRIQITVTAEKQTARSRIQAVVSLSPAGDIPYTLYSWRH